MIISNRTQLKTFTEGLLGGESIDDDLFDALATAEKDEIEELREWEFLKKADDSQNASSSAINLPDDFRSPIWLFVGDDTVPYSQIPFEQKHLFSNSMRVFYLDVAARTYRILGAVSGGVAYMYYIYQTPDITSDANNVPVWRQFVPLLGYRIAKKYYAAAQEERALSWDDRWDAAAEAMLASMFSWDDKLKKRALDNGYSNYDLQNASPIIDVGSLGR